MVITNIYFRAILGAHVLLIGIVLLKIYFDKDKDTIWGSLYRTGEKGYKKSSSAEQPNKIYSRIYLIMGYFSIIAGLIVIFFGFRLTR
jgi:uncharacterized membrane protein HdeD (DUF308 family)